MKFLKIFRTLLRTRNCLKGNINFVATYRNRNVKILNTAIGHPFKIHCFSSDESVISNNEIEFENDYNELENEQTDQYEYAKNLLFPHSTDLIIKELSDCASVEQVLGTLRRYDVFLKTEHITQAILVLKDLQHLCYHYENFNEKSLHEFTKKLLANEEFQKLLNKVKDNLEIFEPKLLSFVLLYLFKLKMPVEDDIMQLIAYKVRDHMENKFNLDVCARLLRVTFSENSSRPYYISLKIIPKIIDSIEKCDSVEDFGHLTICLNKLNNILSSETYASYKNRVQYFLDNKLHGKDYRTILKIVAFLNYPKYRSQNSILISHCLLKMKKEISLLNIPELLLLYEVFFKNQEPGDILNEIQRKSAKFLQQLEENEFVDLECHLRLFSAFIYFSPPIHRAQFKNNIDKFLRSSNNLRIFDLQRKILSYVKTSDKKICEQFWTLGLQLLNETKDDINAVAHLCVNYKRFNTDLTYYRHYKFERNILETIRKFLEKRELIFTTNLTIFLSFVMIYGKDELLLDSLIKKFEKNYFHMKATDCLLISESLYKFKKHEFASKYTTKLCKRLHEITTRLSPPENPDFIQNNVLLKAAILRQDDEDFIVEDLIYEYKKLDHVSSKLIENLYYIFTATDSIIPEVINKCTEYIVNYSNAIVGFNAERVLTTCFYLGYHPINDDRFFETAINIILRDQERLSGLAFLQTALSLCFFNRLPSSFIKQIFNVEFMDKLDVELTNCYSKDVYPQRVRWRLMQLNRAVCLQYPQFNVPWFHQKFVEDISKRRIQEPESEYTQTVRDHLVQVVGRNNIQETVTTPYGHHIDFVICFDANGTLVFPESSNISKRLALLLVKPYAYTHFYIHLKGKYQMKIRHLELLGYEVATIKFSIWNNLLFSVERLEYLQKVIWPQKQQINSLNR